MRYMLRNMLSEEEKKQVEATDAAKISPRKLGMSGTVT